MTTEAIRLDLVLSRVLPRVVFDGDCWIWQGALQASGQVPSMRWGNSVINVRRLLLLAQGRKIDGLVVTYTCGHRLCVQPDHIQVMTRKSLQRRTAREMPLASQLARNVKLSARERARSVLTPEMVEQIRLSSETGVALAPRYGVTPSAINDIKAGRTWRDYGNPFLGLIR